MKIQNVAVQLQLGESLIQFYTEHSLERQYFEGRYRFIYWDRCLHVHGNFLIFGLLAQKYCVRISNSTCSVLALALGG